MNREQKQVAKLVGWALELLKVDPTFLRKFMYMKAPIAILLMKNQFVPPESGLDNPPLPDLDVTLSTGTYLFNRIFLPTLFAFRSHILVRFNLQLLRKVIYKCGKLIVNKRVLLDEALRGTERIKGALRICAVRIWAL